MVLEKAVVERAVNEIRSSPRPDQYPWGDLAKKNGFDFVLEVIKELTPEVYPLIPRLPEHLNVKEGKSYKIPDYLVDLLWVYGQFLAFYLKTPHKKEWAIDWFKKTANICPPHK